MYNPLVSIIVPVYNRETLIGKTLDSVLKQSYQNWECLIIDDGSSDNSFEVIKSYIRIDTRFKFSKRDAPLKGANVCRNIGIDTSHGEYIIFLDSDDLLEAFCVSNRVKSFLVKKELDFLVFPMTLFKKEVGDLNLLWNIKTHENDLLRFLRVDTPWQTTQVMWKKASLIKLGGWDVELLSWQDWDLHVRALINRYNYEWIDTPPDCNYRTESSNTIRMSEVDIGHLTKRVLMLEKIVMLSKINGLDFNNPFISLYYLFSRQLSLGGAFKYSLSTWRYTKKRLTISFKLYFWIKLCLMIIYFSHKYKLAFVSKIIYKLNHIFVDHSLIYHNSKTIKRISWYNGNRR